MDLPADLPADFPPQAQPHPHGGWPGNELEEVLSASLGVPGAGGRIIEVLGRSFLWVPLPGDGGPPPRGRGAAPGRRGGAGPHPPPAGRRPRSPRGGPFAIDVPSGQPFQ
ncbi:hypothetical protein ACFTY7_41415, partial [Streptomyces sp. NPDC057062]